MAKQEGSTDPVKEDNLKLEIERLTAENQQLKNDLEGVEARERLYINSAKLYDF